MNQGISRFRKGVVGVIAGLTATAGLIPLAATGAGAVANFDLTRLAGADRYETAAAIATTSFPSAGTVVITTGENFPDALSANYIAGQNDAPILLTRRDSVPPATAAALNTMKPTRLIVVGGTDAVGTGGVPSGTWTTTRYAGATRYETAATAANAGTTIGTVNGLRTAVVASGENFPDALAAGPAAWKNDLPLLLTPRASLHPATSAFLTSKQIQQVIVMGGTAAIEASVETAIKGLNSTSPIATTRIAGADRTETARLFAEYALANLGFSNTTMDVARGDLYPDALAGGPHAGKENSPILLTVSPSTASASPDTGVIRYATDHRNTLASGHIFGGTAAVSTAVEQAIEAAAGAQATTQAYTITGAGETGTGLAPATRNCTITAPAGTVLDLRLFPTANISQTTGSVLFVDANSDEQADETPLTSATIVAVEGAPTAAAAEVNDVTSDGSTIVTISSTGATDVTLVAWTDAAGLTAQALDLVVPSPDNSNPKAPRESFGLGCRTVFANEAAGGAFGPTTVTATDKANNFFQAGGNNFFYDANDTFQIGGVPQASGEAGLAAFEARLSPEDSVAGTYAPDPSGVSTFNLTDAAPAAPASTTTTVQGRNVTLSFPESSTATTDAYNVYQLIRPGNPGAGTCPDFNTALGRPSYGAPVATIADPTPGTVGGTSLTVTRTDLQENSFYCFAVTAVDEGDESSTGATAVDVQTSSGSETIAPRSLDAELTTSGGFNDRLDAGDVIKVCFDEPLRAPDTGDSIQVTDGTDIATITNGTNATFALGAATTTDVSNGTSNTSCAANQTLVITLTGAPADTNNTTGDNILQLPATITDAAGVTDLAGNNWVPNPVAGQDVVIEVEAPPEPD